MAAQFIGIGPVAPFYYFLDLSFGPRITGLIRSTTQQRIDPHYLTFLLPLILLLHTSEVLVMYFSKRPETRHYWTWAWQMSPLWLSITNHVLVKFMPSSIWRGKFALPNNILIALGFLSTTTWWYMLGRSPYSLTTCFLPQSTAQTEFIAHTRLALQSDEIYSFASSFLWIAYSAWEFWTLGLLAYRDWLFLLLVPAFIICTGPGFAFGLTWIWRESKLVS